MVASSPASGPPWDALVPALLACLAAVVFVGSRLLVPAECAWLPPQPSAFTAAGLVPRVQPECRLPEGSLVAAVRVADGQAVVTVEPGAQDLSLDLVAQHGALLNQAWRAGGTLLFVAALFALSGFAISRRPHDRAAGSHLVFSAALLGSTLVTVAGLPPSWAFEGALRWLFVVNVGFFYTLAWSSMLAWALQFPTPLAPWLGGTPARMLVSWAPPVLWAILALAGGGGAAFPAWMARAIGLQTGFTVLLLVAAQGVLVWRLVRSRRPGSDPVQRQQLSWLGGSALVSGLLALALWILPSLLTGRSALPEELIGLPGLCYVAGMGVAMLRYRLFDLDVVLGRTLVFAALTLVAVSVYLLTVAALTSLIADQTGVAVAGAVAVAILVNPVRVRLERWVSRALYGDRDDPYVALSRLAGLLTAREVTWSSVAADLRRAFRVPYVAVRTPRGTAVAESGEAPAEAGRLLAEPLAHAGLPLGSLVVATRGRGERFAPAERRLLQDLGNQVAAALHSEHLDRELRASRERLVLAREEERRLLRRTLHDDIGPALAAIGLRTATVRRLTPDATATAAEVLDRIESDATRAADTVRRLAYDLRPPVLDELGLARALAEQLPALAPLAVHLDTGGADEASLPAAVEVAAYRIASAALANVARHAQATECWVTLRRSGVALEIEVADDGDGSPDGFHAGVGLTAMRERAAELGGRCTIGPRPGGGTLLRAALPLGRQR